MDEARIAATALWWAWTLLVVAQIAVGVGLFFLVGSLAWSFQLLMDELRKTAMSSRNLKEDLRQFLSYLEDRPPGGF